MANLKKIIPFLIVAVLFAVGGYLAGNMGSESQGAVLFGKQQAKNIAAVSGSVVLPTRYEWIPGHGCAVFDQYGGWEGYTTPDKCGMLANSKDVIDAKNSIGSKPLATIKYPGEILVGSRYVWISGHGCGVFDQFGGWEGYTSASNCGLRINTAPSVETSR